eukprot:362861-Chlamydomonas_euryale.AAC.5
MRWCGFFPTLIAPYACALSHRWRCSAYAARPTRPTPPTLLAGSSEGLAAPICRDCAPCAGQPAAAGPSQLRVVRHVVALAGHWASVLALRHHGAALLADAELLGS